MKRRQTIYIILLPIVFVMGYFSCVVIHNKIADIHSYRSVIDLRNLFGKDVVSLGDNSSITFDTLFSHKKNLIIFWSPSCKFCRSIFHNQLNSEVVGIFCFPLTDDFEYVEYFVNKHEIRYPQLVCNTAEGMTSVETPFVDAIPMLFIVDNQGNVLEEEIGINNIDSLFDFLYKDINS